MFTPSNIKKLINVTTITFRKNNVAYEVPIYPNTLKPYQNNLIPLSSVVHTHSIYKSVSKGLLHNKEALKAIPGENMDQKIEYILRNGHDKQESMTRDYNTERKTRNVGTYLMRKIRYRGRRISLDEAMEIVKKYDLSKDVKVVGNNIVKDLTAKDADYEREKFKVRVDTRYVNDVTQTFGIEHADCWMKMDGDVLRKVKAWCEQRGIGCEIRDESEDEDEVIC
ncbi:putative exosome subunit [Trachipleistophora hominis]|uniref:Putative exosome subunit n=1 Tax=Trachipleistophora hominis TaxID=72359 RepID=L7JU22_TRAHO|nr:putative exosome subunit [Trachipleistophora hominis]